MNIRTVKHIVTALFCLVLSTSAYSVDELYTSELSGLASINVPFGGNHGHSSPTFGFAIGQTSTNNIYSSSNELNPLLSNPTTKALFDIQYDLIERRWSRFAFGGINALVYDNVLHADGDGGGPVIDPALVVFGIGAAGAIYMNVKSDDDPPSCPLPRVTYTLNVVEVEDPCSCPSPRFNYIENNNIDDPCPDTD